MARSFSTQILAELESSEFKPFLLLELTLDGTTYYYTDCDIPLYYSSNTYNPRGFRFAPINYSLADIVDTAEIEFDNVDSAFTSLFITGTPQSEDVVLRLVTLDSNNDIIGGTAVALFEGQLDSWDLDEERVKITVTSLFHQWKQSTLSMHSPSCRWKEFKSTECNYAGASTWCDRTYYRCKTLSNTTNFGGFRWLPSIIDSDIWWGREKG